MSKYQQLAIKNLNNFIFGHCPNPVKLNNGMVIGGGDLGTAPIQ